MLALARINPGQFVKFRNLTRDLHRHGGAIEARDPFHPAFSLEAGAAESPFPKPIGADHTHAGDNDARGHLLPELRAFARTSSGLGAPGSVPTAKISEMLTSAAGSQQNAIIDGMALGLYISVPFCLTKCSYCNFSSDVFFRGVFHRYVERVCADIQNAPATAERMGGHFEREIDSVYVGGGTPTVLDCQQLERLFVTVRQNFCLQPDSEITVECAPGTLTPAVLDTLLNCGVNRVSLGVQSFVDQEAAAVGRLHKRATVLDDIARLRSAGISNINVVLIAGLPYQTRDSWDFSLAETISAGAPHVSIYMLEVDEDSRLGRELIAGGTRYHAHFVQDEDLTADLYEMACAKLNGAGVAEYEISCFGRAGCESRHNLKYWTRQPHLGFGVDACS